MGAVERDHAPRLFARGVEPAFRRFRAVLVAERRQECDFGEAAPGAHRVEVFVSVELGDQFARPLPGEVRFDLVDQIARVRRGREARVAVEPERARLHILRPGPAAASGLERAENLLHRRSVRQKAEAHMADRQHAPRRRIRQPRQIECGMRDEFKLGLGEAVVVDRVVFERAVRPHLEGQVGGVQHQQPHLLLREVPITAVADARRGDRSFGQSLRLHERLPLRPGNAVIAGSRIVPAEIGVVVVVADHEQCRKPGTAHRLRTQGGFAAALLLRPVAVAHIPGVEQEPRAAGFPGRREVAEVRKRIRPVLARIVLLLEVGVGDQAEQQVAASGVLPHAAAEFIDWFSVHCV